VAHARDPFPVPEDIAEAAAILRRAATLRQEALGQEALVAGDAS